MKTTLQYFAMALLCGAVCVAWIFYYFDPTSVQAYFGVACFLLFTGFSVFLAWRGWVDFLECKRFAEGGDPKAMYELALLLKDLDKQTAIKWAERSASRGFEAAGFLAGFLRYRTGLRNARTFNFFLRAAERGEEAAMRAVANCYKRGHGVLPSDRLAFEWRFRSAISSEASFNQEGEFFGDEKPEGWVPGYLLSRYTVGMCYLNGDGCGKNLVEGYAWLQLAAHEGLIIARQRMKLLDGFDSHQFRLLVQERSLVLQRSLEEGRQIEPVSVGDVGGGASSGALLAVVGAENHLSAVDKSQPISAWRAFLSVLLVGNFAAGLLTLGSKSSQQPPIPHDVYGILYASFFVSAFLAAFYGRKLPAAIHLLLLAVSSTLVSAALAYWYSPAFLGPAIGAVMAGGAIVLPVAIPLMHWRHAIANFVFYALLVLHLFGLTIFFMK